MCIRDRSLPVYGDGQFTRDWLYVVDHAIAIDKIFHSGQNGETYNIGGFNEWTNLDLIHLLCEKMDIALGNIEGISKTLITYVKDRPGHDKRYAIDANKLKTKFPYCELIHKISLIQGKIWMKRMKRLRRLILLTIYIKCHGLLILLIL